MCKWSSEWLHMQIMIAMQQWWFGDVTAGGGTETVSGNHGDNNSCCLTDDVILRLAKLGVKVPIIFSVFMQL